MGIIFLGDAVSPLKLVSSGLILAGVVGLNLSGVPPRDSSPTGAGGEKRRLLPEDSVATDASICVAVWSNSCKPDR